MTVKNKHLNKENLDKDLRLTNPYNNPNQKRVRNDSKTLKFNHDKPKVSFEDPVTEDYRSKINNNNSMNLASQTVYGGKKYDELKPSE